LYWNLVHYFAVKLEDQEPPETIFFAMYFMPQNHTESRSEGPFVHKIRLTSFTP